MKKLDVFVSQPTEYYLYTITEGGQVVDEVQIDAANLLLPFDVQVDAVMKGLEMFPDCDTVAVPSAGCRDHVQRLTSDLTVVISSEPPSATGQVCYGVLLADLYNLNDTPFAIVPCGCAGEEGVVLAIKESVTSTLDFVDFNMADVSGVVPLESLEANTDWAEQLEKYCVENSVFYEDEPRWWLTAH